MIGARVLRGVRISRGTVRTRRLLNDPGFVGQKDSCVVCVYAFAVVIIPTIIHASVLLCCYCRCHVVGVCMFVCLRCLLVGLFVCLFGRLFV